MSPEINAEARPGGTRSLTAQRPEEVAATARAGRVACRSINCFIPRAVGCRIKKCKNYILPYNDRYVCAGMCWLYMMTNAI